MCASVRPDLGRQRDPARGGEVERATGDAQVDGGAPLGHGGEARAPSAWPRRADARAAPRARTMSSSIAPAAGRARRLDDPPAVLAVLHVGDLEEVAGLARHTLHRHRVEARHGRARQGGEEEGAACHDTTVGRAARPAWEARRAVVRSARGARPRRVTRARPLGWPCGTDRRDPGRSGALAQLAGPGGARAPSSRDPRRAARRPAHPGRRDPGRPDARGAVARRREAHRRRPPPARAPRARGRGPRQAGTAPRARRRTGRHTSAS